MKVYLPPQISRLAIAFAVFITLFLVARHFLVPATFGQYGHYRGASLEDNAKPEIHFSGQKACFDCHQDIEDLKLQGPHKEIRCETCHGPGQVHVTSGEAKDIIKPSGREFCGNCHGANAAKKKETIHQVNMNTKNPGKNCTECHNSHQPWKVKK
jgi:hypothetical protein